MFLLEEDIYTIYIVIVQGRTKEFDYPVIYKL